MYNVLGSKSLNGYRNNTLQENFLNNKMKHTVALSHDGATPPLPSDT